MRSLRYLYLMRSYDRRVVSLLGGLFLMVSVAQAGDYYTSVPYLATVKIGADSEGATPVGVVYGKEYVHTDWLSVYLAGGDPNLTNIDNHDAFGVPDPLQVVSWDGLPGPIGGNSGSDDSFDYGVPGFNYPEGQVDGLANHGDFLFKEVISNLSTLLFSVTGDISAASVLPPPGGAGPIIIPKAHVHFEDPAGPDALSPLDIWAGFEAPPVGPGAGPGVNHHTVWDMGDLEVWGPEPPSHSGSVSPVTEGYVGTTNTADADRFSLDMDSASGVSVWAYDITTKFVAPFVPHADIVAAVEELFLGPGLRFDDASRRAIDVDALMVRDLGSTSPTAPLWGPGDELLFSIDPVSGGTILDASGAVVGPAPLIDGGEIMHLVKTSFGVGPGTLVNSFLSHGGHLWDTAFPVAATFGYYFEDVDALESVGTLTGNTDIPTPEPASLMLGLLGVIGITFIRQGVR